MAPRWLDIARGELGVHEIPGSQASERIIHYDDCTTLAATSDEVPLCSAFVNWCMKQAGIEGTHLANARSWLEWGRTLDAPQVGCVVIFSRGDNPAAGHVGFVVEVGQYFLKVLGGNQADSVRVSSFPLAHVLGYRWPKTNV